MCKAGVAQFKHGYSQLTRADLGTLAAAMTTDRMALQVDRRRQNGISAWVINLH